jgi:hypothetical protein
MAAHLMKPSASVRKSKGPGSTGVVGGTNKQNAKVDSKATIIGSTDKIELKRDEGAVVIGSAMKGESLEEERINAYKARKHAFYVNPALPIATRLEACLDDMNLKENVKERIRKLPEAQQIQLLVAASLERVKIVKQGYLTWLQSNQHVLKYLQQDWAVLEDRMLKFFNKPEDERPHLIIPLSGFFPTMESDAQLIGIAEQHGLTALLLSNEKTGAIVTLGATEDTAMSWLREITSEIYKDRSAAARKEAKEKEKEPSAVEPQAGDNNAEIEALDDVMEHLRRLKNDGEEEEEPYVDAAVPLVGEEAVGGALEEEEEELLY